MRRILDILLILAIVFAVTGCTLMLEEPENTPEENPTENGDGFSAPKTEQNEFGVTSYQFKEGVKLLEEQYRDYIIKVETDTTTGITNTYFKKSVPADMLPATGDLLATTLQDVFPFTLNDKVDVVQKGKDGNIIMTSHSVPLEDVYKELSFDVAAFIVNDDTDSRSDESGHKVAKLKAIGAYSPMGRNDDDIDWSKTLDVANVYINLIKGPKVNFTPFDLDNPNASYSLKLVSDVYTDKRLGNQIVQKWIGADPTKIRWGYESDFLLYLFLKSKALVKLHYSLAGKLKGSFQLKFQFGYGYQFSRTEGFISFPIIGTCGYEVPKDGIFPHQQYLSNADYLIKAQEAFFGVSAKVLKMGVAINFAFTADMALKYKSEKLVKYEKKCDWDGFTWSFEASLFNHNSNLKVGGLESTETRSEVSPYTKTTGFRINPHADVSLIFGASVDDELIGARFAPLIVNCDAEFKSVDFEEYGTSKPSQLLDGNGKILYAADKSYDDADLSLGMTFDSQIGLSGDIPDLISQWNLLDLTKSFLEDNTKPIVFPFHYSKFPQLETKLVYDKGSNSSEITSYIATIAQEEDRDMSETPWFGNVRLLVYDDNFKFIKEVQPLPSNKYFVEPDVTYKFENLRLNTNTDIGSSTYFYCVPVFSDTETGMTYFSRPKRYMLRGDWGRILSVQALNITNASNAIGYDKLLTGFAFDGKYSFEVNTIKYVYLNVKFLDENGYAVFDKDYCYSTGKNRAGTIKGIFMIKHDLDVMVDRAVVTMYYKNPYWQTSMDPSLRNTVLDEGEAVDLSTPFEDWPEYDYVNHDDWIKEGYKQQ